MVSARIYRLTVFSEMPKRLAISRNETWSRRCRRRIMPSNATSIPPISCLWSSAELCSKRGAIPVQFMRLSGQFSMQINKYPMNMGGMSAVGRLRSSIVMES